ncbi:MAG: phosphotransferase [Proteobacteria bacterium]|nr:phosphotransferase [Pseudomonadota bacterium]
MGFKNPMITLLAGDASTRKYYRVTSLDKSLIFMKCDPFNNDDANVRSLEAYSGMGINVPEVYELFPELGVLVQEDIGDLHLQNIKDKGLLKKYYKDVVDMLIKFQRQALAHEKNGKKIYPNSISFTKEKFMSELNMTTEFYIEKLNNKKISHNKKDILQKLYTDIVDRMMQQPTLLQHRDYHSRNLMIYKDSVYMIDIQDSRQGPFTYDIASLVIDPYIDLDNKLYEEMIGSYYDGIKDVIGCSHKEYLRYYDLCFIQRGIKILGTFAYQKTEKGNSGYLKYIPISIEKLKKTCTRFPEWQKTVNEEILI